MPPDLAFNTAISFVTNTNWQAYSGEAQLSYLSQMVGLTVQNFVSAGTGMAVAVAVIRGFVAAKGATLGNFWVDLFRSVLWILLPLSVGLALFLSWQGVPQTLQGAVMATGIEGHEQVIARGPAAAQIAIKQLGTNGGGFFGVNSAHPFENPTILSNLVQSCRSCLFRWLSVSCSDAWPGSKARVGHLCRHGGDVRGGPCSDPCLRVGRNPALGIGANMEGKEQRFARRDAFCTLGGVNNRRLQRVGQRDA